MTSGMQTSAPSRRRSASSSPADSPIASAWVSGRPSIARAIASSSPSRSSRLPDPRERVQARAPARGEAQDGPAERADEGFVFAFEVDDLAAAAEHPGAEQPGLREARFAEVGAADDERVRVVQEAAGVEEPGVVDEAPAVHVAADVDPFGAEAGFGDRGVDGLEVRGRDLVPGPLARPARTGQPRWSRRWERSRRSPRARARRSASAARWRSGSHLSPRQSGRPNVNAIACWPHIRSNRSGAALAWRSTRHTAASSSSRASGPVSGTLTVT